MPLYRFDAARVADLCNEAGRPRMTAEIILKATDLDDARRRLAASDPVAMGRADMLRRLGVTEEQVATMRADRVKARAAVRAARDLAPLPPRTALERHDASTALMARQAATMAMSGGFPGVVR